MKGNSFEMIIWWSDEDAASVVKVPELAGCMAHGKTRPEAIRQAEAAIRLWIKTAKEDGVEIPRPRRAFGPCVNADGIRPKRGTVL
jgi:predicted RNase H-like HicB family nuclease